jgi:pyrimidine operon attenuation protein / uracil phosphoribosyltransferase
MSIIADSAQVASLVERLGDEAAAAMRHAGGTWAVIGIRSRGDTLARRLAQRLKPQHVGSLDIGLYRDDLSEIGPQPVVRTTEIDFDISGVNVLLVDDVLMSGRSVRAALQSLIDLGRPRCVKLLALVDRGGRELPIAPDFVGLRLNADRNEVVDVKLKPEDDRDSIEARHRPRAMAGAA